MIILKNLIIFLSDLLVLKTPNDKIQCHPGMNFVPICDGKGNEIIGTVAIGDSVHTVTATESKNN